MTQPPTGWNPSDQTDSASLGPREPESAATGPARPVAPPTGRLAAAVEVVICSGFPTQLGVGWLLQSIGWPPFDTHGQLSPPFVVGVSLVDALLIVALVTLFIRMGGERVSAVLLGRRPPARESLLGLPLALGIGLLAAGVLAAIRVIAPALHDVAQNPFESLIRTPADALLVGAIAVVAGGVREEVQRAFVLHRFSQRLGGGWLGLVLFSLVFGAGHLIQGWDVALTTGLMGAAWGAVYLWRRSVAAPMVSHALFNAAEVFQYALTAT